MKKFLVSLCLVTLITNTACSSLFSLFSSDDDERKTTPVAQAEPPTLVEPAPLEKATPTQGVPKKKLLVLPFVNRSSYGGPELGLYAADEMKAALLKAGDFVLVPESELEDSDKFSTTSGTFNYKLIFERARARGAIGVVTGTIDDMDIRERGDEVGVFQTRYQTVNANVRYSFHDTTTEKLIYQKSSDAEVTEEHTRFFSNREPDALDPNRGQGAVAKALEKTYPLLMMHAKKISWVGRIAKAGFNRYYVNAGEASGITKGQLLKVFEEGNEIVDGQSGSVLGIAPGRFKGLLKVVDTFGTDGAIAVIHSGGHFREKDRVEVFTPPPH